ncbi:hypothetical protein DZC72_00990 [Maribacter algicola]|uniref:Uncharacterized protein n=1 Tax=Maribacter algicola TaxID=2498892 RepID=A0A426RJX2_9FLAO|nr:hypothetical protein DZC72_00990 [Maribacter algicola]
MITFGYPSLLILQIRNHALAWFLKCRGAGDGRALKKGLVDLFSEGASLPRWPSKPDGVTKKAT